MRTSRKIRKKDQWQQSLAPPDIKMDCKTTHLKFRTKKCIVQLIGQSRRIYTQEFSMIEGAFQIGRRKMG